MGLAERIDALRNRQEAAEKELARLQGRKDQLIAQLKDRYQVETVEEAVNMLDAMQKEVDRREGRLERMVTELEGLAGGD